MKRIIIGIPSLNSGGVEVSLVRFVKELSRNKNYKISLLLLKKEGIYLEDIPKSVNILTVKFDDDIYSYFKKIGDIKSVSGIFNKVNFFFYRNNLRKYLKSNDWESYYKLLLSHTLDIDGEYDLAIDWHGYGNFITSVIADKVVAKKRATWIHDEKCEWLNKVNFWLDKYNRIFCVGKSCLNNVLKYDSSLKNKVEIFYNMTDYVNVRKKSAAKIDFSFDKNKVNIVTVGRLEWQKGYDIAIGTAKILKEKGINFCWYVIGTGSLRVELQKLTLENGVSDYLKFLGVVKNPFPYVKNADFFVLTSRHEGYCLATLEAKILGSVIIATDIESNREQIVDEKNGFLCNLDSLSFANKIIELCNDKKKITVVKDNLANENFDYSSEFKKLEKLMEE